MPVVVLLSLEQILQICLPFVSFLQAPLTLLVAVLRRPVLLFFSGGMAVGPSLKKSVNYFSSCRPY